MANKEYTIFSQNGTCKCNLSAPVADPQPLPNEERGEIIVEGHYGSRVIYRDGEIINKPESSITIGQTGDTVTLRNLLNPTVVDISGNGTSFKETVLDGVLEFTVDTPGTYKIQCQSKFELPIEFTVTIQGGA